MVRYSGTDYNVDLSGRNQYGLQVTFSVFCLNFQLDHLFLLDLVLPENKNKYRTIETYFAKCITIFENTFLVLNQLFEVLEYVSHTNV